ncbi:MAG: lactate utilization protein [Lachnospiraceae bacterium]
MNPKEQAKEVFAKTLIKKMEQRQFEAHYVPAAADALQLIKDIVPTDASVTFGGSETLKEIGFIDYLPSSSYTVYDRATATTQEEREAFFATALNSDYFFMSSNAITMDGQLVNIDGTGNRVAFLCFGPKNVVVVASLNKVVGTVDEAIQRVHNLATPPNAFRLGLDTPCKHTGTCVDCTSPNCICAQVVTTRFSKVPGRIKVILVGEELGY